MRTTEEFTHAQFVAHLSDKMTFTKYGDLILQLVVPFDFKELAIPLSNAFGLPLHIDVQLWKPFTEAMTRENEAAG